MLIRAPKVTARLSGYQSAPLLEENFLAVRVVLASTHHDPLHNIHRQFDIAPLRLKHFLKLIGRRRLTEQVESHVDGGPCPARVPRA